ncbi:isocitrate/isopropylmalate family dehydrogenase [Pantoea sp. Mhis]|nr:isocitrate/isopropylmalate family dehydrogenase [Pantoea sp. Mhis]MXP56482.1 hypothetical protein [Pantoea sp. Mhis]
MLISILLTDTMAQILSLSLLLRHSLNRLKAADIIERDIQYLLEAG